MCELNPGLPGEYRVPVVISYHSKKNSEEFLISCVVRAQGSPVWLDTAPARALGGLDCAACTYNGLRGDKIREIQKRSFSRAFHPGLAEGEKAK